MDQVATATSALVRIMYIMLNYVTSPFVPCVAVSGALSLSYARATCSAAQRNRGAACDQHGAASDRTRDSVGMSEANGYRREHRTAASHALPGLGGRLIVGIQLYRQPVITDAARAIRDDRPIDQFGMFVQYFIS